LLCEPGVLNAPVAHCLKFRCALPCVGALTFFQSTEQKTSAPGRPEIGPARLDGAFTVPALKDPSPRVPPRYAGTSAGGMPSHHEDDGLWETLQIFFTKVKLFRARKKTFAACPILLCSCVVVHAASAASGIAKYFPQFGGEMS
jgi:hypothetical protein